MQDQGSAGEDGLNTAKGWIRRRCWRAAPTPKAMGEGKCEVLKGHQQGKRLGKGHEKRQEAKSGLIFKNKIYRNLWRVLQYLN